MSLAPETAFLRWYKDDVFSVGRLAVDADANLYVTDPKTGSVFVRDPYGVRNCHAVGVENMMWSSDFPHHINDWPYSRYLINEMSLGVAEADRRKLFCENAGRLYGFIA